MKRILATIPPGVTVAAAVKTRTVAEAIKVLRAGVTILGHNYVQEAAAMISALDWKAEAARLGVEEPKWHMFGHLQRNKVKKALEIFDMIQSLDSPRLAREISSVASGSGIVMEVLVEVNIGNEDAKTGVPAVGALDLILEAAGLPGISVRGLMTMGPTLALRENWDGETLRPWFRKTRQLFENIHETMSLRADFSQSRSFPGAHPGEGKFNILSMGMSDSYGVAIKEGATMVRLGTCLFGPG